MRLSRLVAAALLLAVVGATPQAHAFTLDSQSANNADGSPRFSDPDESAEKATDQSRPSGFFFGGGSGRQSGPFGSDADADRSPMPSAAQIGAGDHGFNNYSGFGRR